MLFQERVGFVSSNGRETFDIFVTRSDQISLNQLVNQTIDYYRGFLPDFALIESRQSILSDRSSFVTTYDFYDSIIGKARSMEILTKDTVNQYSLVYTASAADFSTDLPIIQRMVESFKIL